MNLKKMAITLGAGILVVGGLANRVLAAQNDPGVGHNIVSIMATMHDSPAMERMRSQMPPDLQRACDAAHDQMLQWAGRGGPAGPGIMGGGGSPMMNGSGGGMMSGWDGS